MKYSGITTALNYGNYVSFFINLLSKAGVFLSTSWMFFSDLYYVFEAYLTFEIKLIFLTVLYFHFQAHRNSSFLDAVNGRRFFGPHH